MYILLITMLILLLIFIILYVLLQLVVCSYTSDIMVDTRINIQKEINYSQQLEV